MKKKFILWYTLLLCVLFCSCQSSSVCVGELKNNDPVVRVKTVHNSFFLYGLLGRKQIKATDYTQGLESYKVKNYRSFVDCVLNGVTFGIYTPTTTEIYLPANYKLKERQKAN